MIGGVIGAEAMIYRLSLEPDDNGTVLVTSPDFPLVTFGEDRADVIARATEAAEAILQSMIDGDDDIPPASTSTDHSPMLRLPLQTRLKVGLYMALRSAGLRRADLMRLLGWQRESVDRLFRLNHNSKLENLDAAFAALGKRVDVSFDKVAAA